MLKRLFGFDHTKTTIRREIVAGITTFLTMSYILAVNPTMFGLLDGMPSGAVFTSTTLAAIIGCLAMAFLGKLPFGLAPGMGLNAFFVYSVCLGMGYSWQFALTAVFIEGIIFILLTLGNIREAIVNAIPQSLRNAIGAGIGLFIAFIGLSSAGVVIHDDATLVALGDITSVGRLHIFLLEPLCLLIREDLAEDEGRDLRGDHTEKVKNYSIYHFSASAYSLFSS